MSDGVYIYEHINYDGYQVRLNDTNDYNLNDLIRLGARNDDISSIKIIGDYEVEIYEHHNFGGRKYTTQESIINFVNIGWNDKVSSIKIRKINSPAPAPAPVQSNINDGIYDKVRDGIVTLSVINGSSAWVGSGFFIKMNNNYFIITVAHNVLLSTRNTKMDKIYASISNINNSGDHKIIQCSVVGVAGYADIAVLKVNETINNQQYLEWGNSRESKPGDRCYVIGDPRGIDAISITDGIIRDNKYIYNNVIESMCISAPIYGGNSGGPITDINGKVIGIVSYGYSNTDTLSWGVSQSILEEITNKIISNNEDYIGGEINAIIYPVDAIYSYVNNLIPNKLEGYYVDSTNNNNLQKNDRILKIWNKKLGLYHNQNTPSDIYLNPNMSLTIEINRNNNISTIYTNINELSLNEDKPIGSSNDIKLMGPIVKDLPEA